VQHDQQTIADYPVGGVASTPTNRYVYASYIDEPVVRKAAGTSGTIHYYHRNQQYSITAMTTSTGAVAERYAYTAYGQPTILNASGTVLTSSAVGNRYTYTGREWDETLGLHHFRARWMSPLAGRFLGRDPIGFKGSPYGLYEFVDSKPLMMVDPSGECSIASIQAALNLIQSYISAYQSLPFVFPLYANNPHQHCVWNCRMTQDKGAIFSATQSLLKEYIDEAFADLRDSLQADGCWCVVPEAFRDFAQDSADSAFQSSDYWDNGMGILCGSSCLLGHKDCESCCSSVGSGPDALEGPGTSRPFGARSQFPHNKECPGDAD
jgi:RHS repeat-associated protein